MSEISSLSNPVFDPEMPYPKREIHNGVYAGSHAVRLVAAADADAHNYIHGFSDSPVGRDTDNQAYQLKVSGELDGIDDENLYLAAPSIAKNVWFEEGKVSEDEVFYNGQFHGYAKPFKNWLKDEATQEQVVNVIQAVEHKRSEMARSPAVVEKIRGEGLKYAERIQKAFKEGWLAAGSIERVDGYVKGENDWMWGVASGDMRPGVPAWAISPNLRYPSFYTPQIAFNGGTNMRYENIDPNEVEQRVEESAFHEFNHAFLGHIDYPWLNEAVTEHIAQVLKGNVTIDGQGYTENTKDRVAYRKEIGLLLALVEASKVDPENTVTMADFTWAYSSLESHEITLSDKLKASTGIGLDEMDRLLVSEVETISGAKLVSTKMLNNAWHKEGYVNKIEEVTDKLKQSMFKDSP